MTAPQWRVWIYGAPAIVLGCAQHSLHEFMAEQLSPQGKSGLPVLVRESGGGAVLTGPWLMGVSLVLPSGHPWLGAGLLQSYQQLGQLHAAALAELGVATSALPPQQIPFMQAALASRGLPALDWACFGSLSPWEVVDPQGRKLVGLAQRRQQTGVLLVAGSLLRTPDWSLLCDALGRQNDAAVLRQRTVSCEQLLGRVLPPEVLSEAVVRRLAQALG